MTERTEDKLVSLLAELVGHETVNPPGKEQALAGYLANRLEAFPVDFNIDVHEIQPDCSNVIVRAGDQPYRPSRGDEPARWSSPLCEIAFAEVRDPRLRASKAVISLAVD